MSTTIQFETETRDFANNLLARYQSNTGIRLDDASRSTRDAAAFGLLTRGLQLAVEDAVKGNNAALAVHFRDLQARVPRKDTFKWLNELACEGWA